MFRLSFVLALCIYGVLAALEGKKQFFIELISLSSKSKVLLK